MENPQRHPHNLKHKIRIWRKQILAGSVTFLDRTYFKVNRRLTVQKRCRMQTHTDRQTERQRQKQRKRQTDRQTDRHTLTHRETIRQTDRQTHAHTQRNKETDRETGRQTDRHTLTHRETKRQTDTQRTSRLTMADSAERTPDANLAASTKN